MKQEPNRHRDTEEYKGWTNILNLGVCVVKEQHIPVRQLNFPETILIPSGD